MFKKIILLIIAVFIIPNISHANPYSPERYLGFQYPDTFHIQLSICSMYGGNLLINKITKNTERIALTEIGPDSFTMNSGSGIESYTCVQFCDCDLSTGNYNYQFEVDGSSYGEKIYIYEQVVDPPPSYETYNPPADGDTESDYEQAPWEISDGPWPKGVDCADWCANNSNPDIDFPEEDGDVDQVEIDNFGEEDNYSDTDADKQEADNNTSDGSGKVSGANQDEESTTSDKASNNKSNGFDWRTASTGFLEESSSENDGCNSATGQIASPLLLLSLVFLFSRRRQKSLAKPL